MSTMLEQAIVDAEALKEAAVKNAETLVLEKYSNQIKDAVETLLEQEEGMDPMAELAGEMEESPPAAPEAEEESAVMENIPLAVTSENNDQVEIPLDALYEEITKLSESMRFDGDFIEDPEIQEHNLTENSEKTLEEELLEMLEAEDLELEDPADTEGEEKDTLDTGDLKNENVEEDIFYEISEMEKAGDIDDDLVAEIAEALKVDLAAGNLSGWAGRPISEIELAEEELLALEQDSEIREKMSAMRAAVKDLGAVNESVLKENATIKKQLNKLKETVLVLDEKLKESNLNNAKLLYQNKALNSNSMNERQKHKLVESISNAESIEEAKVIFETLNNTVGSTSRKTPPNSLSEAVQKSSSMILSSRERKSAGHESNPTFNRWKSLVGIDKN